MQRRAALYRQMSAADFSPYCRVRKERTIRSSSGRLLGAHVKTNVTARQFAS